MAALDAKARATALKLLNKYGKSVTHTIVTEGSYDPITGDVSAPSTTTEVPKALVEDFNGVDYISGLVEKGDRKLTIPASGFAEPKPNDRFTVGSDVYTVIAVETVWSGDQAAIYVSQVRK
jgi:hypothetical protein